MRIIFFTTSSLDLLFVFMVFLKNLLGHLKTRLPARYVEYCTSFYSFGQEIPTLGLIFLQIYSSISRDNSLKFSNIYFEFMQSRVKKIDGSNIHNLNDIASYLTYRCYLRRNISRYSTQGC
jgi:hypothetical protein